MHKNINLQLNMHFCSFYALFLHVRPVCLTSHSSGHGSSPDMRNTTSKKKRVHNIVSQLKRKVSIKRVKALLPVSMLSLHTTTASIYLSKERPEPVQKRWWNCVSWSAASQHATHWFISASLHQKATLTACSRASIHFLHLSKCSCAVNAGKASEIIPDSSGLRWTRRGRI